MRYLTVLIVLWWAAWNFGWVLDREPDILRPARDFKACTWSLGGTLDQDHYEVSGPCPAGIVYRMEAP